MHDSATVHADDVRIHLNNRMTDSTLYVKDYITTIIWRESVGSGWGFGNGEREIPEPMEVNHQIII